MKLVVYPNKSNKCSCSHCKALTTLSEKRCSRYRDAGLPAALRYTLHYSAQLCPTGQSLFTLPPTASCSLCLSRCPVALIVCFVFWSHLLSASLFLSFFSFTVSLSLSLASGSVCLSRISFREAKIFNGLWPLSGTLFSLSLPLSLSLSFSLPLSLSLAY